MNWNSDLNSKRKQSDSLTDLDDVDVDADVKNVAANVVRVRFVVSSILRVESSQSKNDFVQHSVRLQRRQQQPHELHVRQQHLLRLMQLLSYCYFLAVPVPCLWVGPMLAY